jgi:hypothetical protein
VDSATTGLGGGCCPLLLYIFTELNRIEKRRNKKKLTSCYWKTAALQSDAEISYPSQPQRNTGCLQMTAAS